MRFNCIADVAVSAGMIALLIYGVLKMPSEFRIFNSAGTAIFVSVLSGWLVYFGLRLILWVVGAIAFWI